MQLLLNGLIIGILYGAVAMCFIFVLKASRIVHGGRTEYTLIGAGTIWWLLTSLGLPLWGGMLTSLALLAALGMIAHRLDERPRFASPVITTAMAAIGLAIFFRALLDGSLGLTAQSRGSREPPPLATIVATEVLDLFGYMLTISDLASIGAAVIAIAGLVYFFRITKAGVTLRRAALTPPDSYANYFVLGWAVATILSALAAALGALVGSASTVMAGENALPALIVGGLESFAGAAVGGLIIGLVEGFFHLIDSHYLLAGGLINIAPFYAMLILLLIKPNGLFHTKPNT